MGPKKQRNNNPSAALISIPAEKSKQTKLALGNNTDRLPGVK